MFDKPLLVRDVMAKNVTTLGCNDKLSTADDVMRLGRIRHIPVLDEDGSLAGIVSQRDLFHSGVMRALGYGQYAASKAREMLVIKEAMHTKLVTTTPDVPLRDAARLLLKEKVGCLPVVEGKKLVGIITESDFVALFSETPQ